MRRWVRHWRAHWWFVREFRPLTGAQYLAVQKERRAEQAEGFDRARHGERMLAAVGASEDQVARARELGYA